MSATITEVTYEDVDLYVQPAVQFTCLLEYSLAPKSTLIEMVQRKIEKWPDTTFKPKHVTAELMRKVLADPQYGFTKPSVTTAAPQSPLSASIAREHDGQSNAGSQRVSKVSYSSYFFFWLNA